MRRASGLALIIMFTVWIASIQQVLVIVTDFDLTYEIGTSWSYKLGYRFINWKIQHTSALNKGSFIPVLFSLFELPPYRFIAPCVPLTCTLAQEEKRKKNLTFLT